MDIDEHCTSCAQFRGHEAYMMWTFFLSESGLFGSPTKEVGSLARHIL